MIYEVRVRSFADADSDGNGDFAGLTSRLDYLQSLGVTALWLLPFYPSPLRDDGYDIADYRSVHPDCGTLDDFQRFLEAAHARDLRVITELVLNHTSDQHPWFQRARHAQRGSPERDWYLWSDAADGLAGARVIFRDFERSNWSWDPVAEQFFFHRFYSSQPDLNYDHPAVREAILDVTDFWLQLGVDGLRLDAVPYLFKREGTTCESLPETHRFLRELRAHVDSRFAGRMLLAEANQCTEQTLAYFGAGDECHMAFNFPLMPRLYLALERECAEPITEVLAQLPDLPPGCQWATFLRNHDELSLEMVSDAERQELWRHWAPDPRARINLGIRRRLAPLLGGDRRRIELLNVLLLTLPGTPVLYYGDEIAMGDNLYLPDRHGVRTPMQWSGTRNAGFSACDPQSLALPVVVSPDYHYMGTNVEAQDRQPGSLLNWTRRFLAARKRHAALFGRGALRILPGGDPGVLAFLRLHDSRRVLVLANLAASSRLASVDTSAIVQPPGAASPVRLRDLLSGHELTLAGPTLQAILEPHAALVLLVAS